MEMNVEEIAAIITFILLLIFVIGIELYNNTQKIEGDSHG